MQSVPQGADQGVAIAAGDEGFGNLKKRAIFESAIVGGHRISFMICGCPRQWREVGDEECD